MTTKRLLILVFLVWVLSGLVFSIWQSVSAQGQVFYRVIDENNGEKIERDLNDIVRTNPQCKPILTIAANEYGKSKVILECAGR